MKKTLLTFLLISITSFAFSQSYPDFDALCGDISIEKDALTGETKYKTPFEHAISFRKLVNNGVEVVYIRVSAISKVNTKGGSVVMRFAKGYIIEREVPTNAYENLDGTFTHFAEFKLKNYFTL